MKTLKWIGIILSSVIIISFIIIFMLSEHRINHYYDQSVQSIDIPHDSASLHEGKRLFISRGCSGCHGANLAGSIFIDSPTLGTLAGSNLTSGQGGVANQYTNRDFVRAIREGIAADNTALIYMPSHEYQWLNDQQVAAIIAYIRSVPAVNYQAPLQLGILMRWQFLRGNVPLLTAEIIDHQRIMPVSITAQASVKYGEYLSHTCRGCHGALLMGGAVPGAPANLPHASNLSKGAAIHQWTEVEFFTAMRTGKRPNGSNINPFMPWNNFKHMNDIELKALWLYLQSLHAAT